MDPGSIPINRADDGELLGYVKPDSASWQSLTIFGYVFSRSTTQADAEQVVREQGLNVLKGVWHYLDPADMAWYPCILHDVAPGQVTVIRTNAMGYQDSGTSRRVILKRPDETRLVKG